MAFPLLPVPLYANVPLGPGVPILLRAPGALAYVAPVLLLADALGLGSLFFGPQWGIFRPDGSPFAIPDSVFSVDFRREFRLADYPIEKGGFRNYDKVAVPYEGRVRFACGVDRPGFLTALDSAVASLELFDVVTPDFVYPSVNLIHYDLTRKADSGKTLLLVDVWVQEVRILETGKYTKTTTPEGASTTNAGTVQSQPAVLPNGQILGGV